MSASTGSYRRPPTAQQAVLAELRRMIRQGELPSGVQLTQEVLAARLGVSRVPVREALKILEGEGQVVYTPHSGYSVAKLDFDDLLEIKRVRELLETEAVRRSMRRLTEDDLEHMSKALEAIESAGDDIGALNVAHRRFHFVLFETAGMPRLCRILWQLWDSVETFQAMRHADSNGRATSFEEHREIWSAAKNRDAKRLIKLLNRHRQRTIDDLRPVLRK